MPKTYVIVTDSTDVKLLNNIKANGNKVYFYNGEFLENYHFMNQTLNQNPLKYTNRISIELSNICNYATYHIKCPLHHLTQEKKVLPLEIINKVIDEIAEYDFSGTISFHTYNEPLIDPRLFYVISQIKNKCPKAKLYLLSNGFYFNQTMADELVEFGVDRIDITAYSNCEFEKLKEINVPIPYSVFSSPKVEDLDDRVDIYTDEANKNETPKPCYNMLNDLVITCDGKISLCCLEWKRKYSFGDLENNTLKEILTQQKVIKDFIELAKGIRKREICQNCYISQTKNILDFNFNGITYRKK